MMTPFEAWHGFKPDLRKLWVFGSRVCVKRTGKRRSKLDHHDFQGIFLGYTTTDENIRYIDLTTRVVKQSHHAIFDEAWYMHPKRPPFAQLLYDVGLEQDLATVEFTSLPPSPAKYPPSKCPAPIPLRAMHLPLPLRLSADPSLYEHVAAARTRHPTLEEEMNARHDISRKDVEMIYLSPDPYENAFEEILDLCLFNPTKHATAGLYCEAKNNRVFFLDIHKSTPAAKIRA